MKALGQAIVSCLCIASAHACSAPLDAFLRIHNTEKKADISVSLDAMNDTLDVFNMADNYGGNGSRYKAAHLSAGSFTLNDIWLEADVWQRDLAIGNFSASINSWHFSGQKNIVEFTNGSAIALRLGAWGNRTDEVARNQSLNLAAAQSAFIRIKQPHDLQWQADLIAGIPLSPHLTLNTWLSAGISRVNFDKVKATGVIDGCSYDLQFYNDSYAGHLSAPCSEPIVLTQLSKPYAAQDIHIFQELRYQSRFYQTGLNGIYQLDAWQMQGGYAFFYTERENVDTRVEQRGTRTFNSNHTLMAELAYAFMPSLSASITAQYMRHQWNAEIPFSYNGVTAKHFDKPYGLLSLGIKWTI